MDRQMTALSGIGDLALFERRSAMIAIGSLFLGACATDNVSTSASVVSATAQRNKANYLAAKAAYNARDLDKCLSYYASNHQIMSKPSPQGREHIRAFFEGSFVTWPDVQIVVENAVAENNWVFGRSLSTATHSNPVMGVAATGRRIEIAFWDLHRFDDGGQIVQTWNLTDYAAAMQQLRGVA